MKTTNEGQDSLLDFSVRLAKQEGTTLRSVGEEGFHLVLRARVQRRLQPFAEKPFVGDGLTPEIESSGWESIRAEGYRVCG